MFHPDHSWPSAGQCGFLRYTHTQITTPFSVCLSVCLSVISLFQFSVHYTTLPPLDPMVSPSPVYEDGVSRAHTVRVTLIVGRSCVLAIPTGSLRARVASSTAIIAVGSGSAVCILSSGVIRWKVKTTETSGNVIIIKFEILRQAVHTHHSYSQGSIAAVDTAAVYL